MILRAVMTKWTGKHGFSAYADGKCRCDVCRESHTKYQRQMKMRRHEQTKLYGLPSHIKHGHSAYNNWGCRCETCGAAMSAKNAEGRARRKKERELAA